MGPPRVNAAPPQYVPIPPGHYANLLENMVAAAARLAALPIDGDSPTAVETRRVRKPGAFTGSGADGSHGQDDGPVNRHG